MRGNPLLTLLIVVLPACGSTPVGAGPPMDSPYVVILGTAQDAGRPQVGCREDCCAAARQDPARRRLVASLLLVEPHSARRWLVDATPDLREQVERATPFASPSGDGRPPLFSGVFLTHAHMGHIAGLLHLGREGYGASDLPLYVAPGMAAFLQHNDPWRFAIGAGTFRIEPLAYDIAHHLTPSLRITAIRVPHRDEFSDTVALRIEGPHASLLYLPDIDKWQRWDRAIEQEIARVDHALLDGTFFADGEIAGRSMADIPHPFISESLARFAALPAAQRAKVRFTHMNHTNPALDPESAAAGQVRRAGLDIAREGDLIRL